MTPTSFDNSCPLVFLTGTAGTLGITEVKTEVVSKPEQCTQKSKKGDLINAHYDGYLLDGSHRTDKAGHPQWFVLGVGQVIKGLDIGMMDMCAGEKRKITVPSDLAFGKNGKDPFMSVFLL
uniref:peptidylprolyl isomerase n=1 Tax=Oryzias latipes TaxID=8090 RepID=A0A3B3IBS3_ORYLA